MAKTQNIHVIRRDEGWVVRKEGTSRATSFHHTQRDAVDAARQIARTWHSQLIIHRRDGRVRDRASYGQDPITPRNPEVLFPFEPPSVSGKAIKDAVSAAIRELKSSSRSSKG